MTTSTKNPADFVAKAPDEASRKSSRIELVGVPSSPGFAMGTVFPVANREFSVVDETLPESRLAAEEQMFLKAISKTSKEIAQIKEISETRAGIKDSLIFATHLMILQDPGLVNGVLDKIRKKHKNAKWAVHVVFSAYIEKFEKIDSPAMRDKAADLRDLYNRLMSAMDDSGPVLEDVSHEDGVVLVAHEFVPSFLMTLKPGQVNAIVMDTGGRTSHVAILSRALQIPAVSGLRNVAALVKSGDTIIVDGADGKVIINPNEEDIRKFHDRQEMFERQRRELFTMRQLEPMTRDGKYIVLHANIEIPTEADKVTDFGATGIGLYRSEFLFFRKGTPTEKEQESAYRHILEKMDPYPVVIRTLDAGGDKLVSGVSAVNESNPFMGWRSIRVCLDREDIFITQLRALLLANTKGNLRILLPMISSMTELRRAKACIAKARKQLEDEGHKLPVVKIGSMIEVPAAVMIVDKLAKEVDFFSLGTNDLIQFTLAVDRTNELITDMFQPHHPAVLSMIYQTVVAAHREGIPVAVCGEMCTDPMSVLLLVGLGVDELSMTPWSVMTTKKIIRSINFEDVRDAALTVLQMDDAESVNEFLHKKYAQTIMELGISGFVGQVEK
ncbi:phosphoenolpyruvate-protein phosphotransferase [Fibrobacter succinogenes subsp. succinogenes S85]|uniref:Phosphoenolpyruvate-protein phosphotransferase n=1 Tax=Fibrobacter succinogenes (strain ATCC 19169 / S85) TaxID=59374 RepID=C9RPE2_FIBSS|nr:phosphoenolpyruvate--protein phosphotransferase [Fibrobacter succinogenes]ACX74606.1 phosphoenolpyruvate-protein phosphotransferase [Fibrobacter succinogenes subsp. succinogenes S85]ADL25049.1 phosphoenolpyruvate-protein phosphotransferase [Fibrobacter succinogenes subsp. succinogenes S85]